MNIVWRITLYDTGALRGGFRVKIEGQENSACKYMPTSTVMGRGKSPHAAYQDACAKLVVKPWLTSDEPQGESKC